MSRVTLVTGGMGGLGEAICMKMADMGYDVATTYSPGNTKVSAWLEEMKAKGYHFRAYSCDVASFESAQECISHITKDMGPVDVPVCDGMTDRGWGRIINISSVNGQKGAFGQTNYSAAKAGMHGFSKALALEVARKGVTVNTISPGYIGTKMVTAIPQDVLDSKIIPQIPMGRLGKPEEVAGLVAYLASDEAAFLTGANIAINGGQHMQ